MTSEFPAGALTRGSPDRTQDVTSLGHTQRGADGLRRSLECSHVAGLIVVSDSRAGVSETRGTYLRDCEPASCERKLRSGPETTGRVAQ